NQFNGSACKARVETIPDKDYILLPLWTLDPLFSSSSKDSFEEPKVNQEKDSVNSTNRVNAISSTVNAASNEVNAVGRKPSIKLPDDLNMPDLEDISIFKDSNENVFGAEADLNKMETTFQVSLIPVTRIYKDHLFKQIIGDIHLAPQTRRMIKSVTDHEPKKLIQALTDPSWIEIYKNKKYESGIVVGNKARLVAQGYIQEDGIDYDEMSSMGELTFFLGLQVTQKDDGIFISQDKYVDEILKNFGFLTVKTASTPMETSKPLMKDENAKDVNVNLYRSMIGSLMYLTSSRPDIMFAICACARFQVTPKLSHRHVVKIIFRYLKGQPKLGLWYPKDSSFDSEAYTDSDYADASLDKKSITGGCQFIRSRLILW
nr:uncharacterized mitochondrial protein AtMg00810-like [Tanacetum cinerariifolium]